jgi:CubicO group peptidase (beta-lactamase class C family)
MTTPKPELAAGDYGFGMSASTERPRSFGHNGGSPGVHAHLQIYPEHGYVFVMLTNQTRAGLPASNQYMVTRLAALTRALIADSAP